MLSKQKAKLISILFALGWMYVLVFRNQRLSSSPLRADKIIRWTANLTGPANALPSNRRIYFHETSGKASVNWKQSCAIESAARENPTRPVQLFLHRTDSVDESHPFYSSVLNELDNLVVILLNTTVYFDGTRLQAWHDQGVWRKSPHKTVHLSDYVRVLTLKKGGGLYMDLDYIVIRSLDEVVLRNFTMTEWGWGHAVGISAFQFDSGHWAIEEWLRRLEEREYQPYTYDWHGLPLLSGMLIQNCSLDISHLESVQERCPDLNVLDVDTFSPIRSSTPFDIITPSKETLDMLNKSYAVHTWNSVSKYFNIDLKSDQLYAKLARKHCPLTVAAADLWP